MRKAFRLLTMLLLVLLAACRPDEPGIDDYKPPDTPTDTVIDENGDTIYVPHVTYRETAVYCSDGTILYLSDREYTNIQLSTTPNPESLLGTSIYRIPTRDEAKVLNSASIETENTQRLLCLDSETGAYYTFSLLGGSVTKAGSKTKYTLRPVRSVEPMDTIHINLNSY